MPTRKILAATITIKIVDTVMITIDMTGCHHGIAWPVAKRNIMTAGVAGGKKEKQVGITPRGSRTTINQTNIGLIINIQTGNNIDCASFNCETEAPILSLIHI